MATNLPLPPTGAAPRPLPPTTPMPQAQPAPVTQEVSEAPPPVRTENLPQEMFSGMPGSRPSGVTICSIYPRDLKSEPFAHGGRGRVIYELKAGSVEKPSYLRVYNTFTMAQNIYQDSDASQLAPKPIEARSFAQNDLVGYWASHFVNGTVGRIGVFICAGDEATPQELEQAKQLQEEFFKEQVRLADEKWFGGERKFNLTEARRATKWLKDLDVKRHPWLADVRYDSTKLCPQCSEQVASTSHYCKECKTNIAAYLMERGRPAPEGWQAVAMEMEFLKKGKA